MFHTFWQKQEKRNSSFSPLCLMTSVITVPLLHNRKREYPDCGKKHCLFFFVMSIYFTQLFNSRNSKLKSIKKENVFCERWSLYQKRWILFSQCFWKRASKNLFFCFCSNKVKNDCFKRNNDKKITIRLENQSRLGRLLRLADS